MKIYQFWSAGTTYYTKSRNLKKAQEIGKGNMKIYRDTCKYLGEQPTVGIEYFIPTEIEEVAESYFEKVIATDPDTMIIDFEYTTNN